MRKTTRWFWFGCLAAVCLAAAIMFVRGRNTHVNVLLVTLDTTRADRIGCYGYESAETPILDGLAKRGMRFERAYVPAPMTAPSHTSLLTGLWPLEHGVFTNGRLSLNPNIRTLAERLRDLGYDNAAFVAAFVLSQRLGLARGFAIYDDDLSKAEAGGDPLHRYRDGKYVVDSAIDWLNTSRPTAASPFFCWVHLYDPHDPYLDHADLFQNKFTDRPYDAEIAYVDRQIGRLVDALEKLGLKENTVIIVVGDHGESLGEHGEDTHGYTLHDSTLRVPLIIVDPRSDKAAGVTQTPVSLVNLFPTILELAGGVIPQEASVKSLLPELAGRPITPQICYSQTEEPYLQAYWSPLQSWTTDRWRYVRTTKPELYDLSADPKELTNLVDGLPDLVSELDGEMAAFESRLKRNKGEKVSISEQEQRALESLGYTGGVSDSTERDPKSQPLPDIKDMLPYLSQMQQAAHLMDEGKLDAAIELLEQLAQVPNFFRARLNLAVCRLQQQDYEDAARWLESALEIDPHSDRAHDMLGFAYLKLRKLDEAEKHFQRLLELQPHSENALLFLGEIAQRREQYPIAMRYYGEVLRINPENLAAREAYGALKAAGISQ